MFSRSVLSKAVDGWCSQSNFLFPAGVLSGSKESIMLTTHTEMYFRAYHVILSIFPHANADGAAAETWTAVKVH